MTATRKCKKCGEVKPEAAFYLRLDTLTRRGACKKCHAKQKRDKIFTNLRQSIREKLRSAKRKGYGVHVSWQEVVELYYKQDCKCSLTARHIDFTRATNLSIDRIDSSKPYTKDNIQLVCRAANYAKHTLSQDDFIQLCKEVVANARK
jgi:hypothetical protein